MPTVGHAYLQAGVYTVLLQVRHPTLGLRVMDFKTGDDGDGPRKAHLGKEGWRDLQLPLYVRLAWAGGAARPGDKVEAGYFLLDAEGKGWTPADFTAEEGSLDVLEGIDFYDDLFIEFNGDDVLPDLEIDSDVLGEYSGSGRDEELEMEGNTSAASETSERDGGWCKPEGTDKTVRKGKRKGKKSKDCLSSDNGIKKKPKVSLCIHVFIINHSLS